jgi:hypothetical protein
MGCKATKTNIILVLAIAAIYALVFTSKVSAAPVTIYDYPERTVSFEVKPLSLLVNLVPGGRGFSGEFEAALGRNIAVVAGLSHLHLALSNNNENNPDETAPKAEELEKELNVSEVSLGGRYYNNIAGHSWFAGARFGGGTRKSLWEQESKDYVDSQMTYLLGLDSGFRWLWKSGMHMRLGGGLEFRRTIARDVSQLANDGEPDEVAASIERDNPTNRIQFSPYFDFGLGITI